LPGSAASNCPAWVPEASRRSLFPELKSAASCDFNGVLAPRLGDADGLSAALFVGFYLRSTSPAAATAQSYGFSATIAQCILNFLL
jgi:hypothetical protein